MSTSLDSCPHCGGHLIGDGYTDVVHCENVKPRGDEEPYAAPLVKPEHHTPCYSCSERPEPRGTLTISAPAGSVTPAPKPEAIERELHRLFGVSRLQAIGEGFCVDCLGPAVLFADELSVHEYAISGLCQACQDSVFSACNFCERASEKALPLAEGATPCTCCGACCRVASCGHAPYDEQAKRCSALIVLGNGSTRCANYYQILQKPSIAWHASPAFGAGCCRRAART
jgi:hypothetical protein